MPAVLQGYFRNRLTCLPLELRLRGKPTRQGHGSPTIYVKLTIHIGLTMEEALAKARQPYDSRQAMGFNQAALAP
jgi:hypothetical protein